MPGSVQCSAAFRLGCCCALLLLLCGLPLHGYADGIVFESARVKQRAGLHLFDADASIDINSTIESGLQSGVPLYFNIVVSVRKVRTFWWDKYDASWSRTYSLVYYELTRHYRVSVVGEDIIRNFRSLLDALEYLGEIRDMPVMPFVSFNPKRKYYGQVKYSLDVAALPLPLQPQTLVSSAWRLSSEVYEWALN